MNEVILRDPYVMLVSTESDMTATSVRNGLLQSLPALELARLRPQLERVSLVPGTRLITAFEPASAAYFVESGFLSCFVGDGGRDRTEVALIGREGMAGVSIVLDADVTPFHLLVQRGGDAYRMSAATLRACCQESGALRETLTRYAYAVMIQIAETGRANARQTVEARLARWLLMAHDRIDGNEIELTHENLSLILGVRRPGITVAIHVLEGERMIRSRRGAIEILDRAKLDRASGGSYGLPEREYERLLGSIVPERVAS